MTTYNYAMATAEHGSERARQALDVRTSSISAGSTIRVSRPNSHAIGAGRLPFMPTTSHVSEFLNRADAHAGLPE